MSARMVTTTTHQFPVLEMSNSAKACKRKQAYSKKEAEEVLVLRLLKRKHEGGGIYLCEHCGWWHVSKQRK